MEPLTAQFIEGLAAGRADPDALARAGEPDAARAARAFESAAEHPDLAGVLDRWVPPLLRAARPGFGADSLHALADARRAAGAKPLDLARTPLLPAVLGASGFLARALRRHPEWIDELSSELPGPPVLEPPPAAWDAIRSFKYRGLLRVAARDLAGRPFEKSLVELSGLADAGLVAALACAAQEEEFAPPALMALGKLGANELNFSSDVDLLFLYHRPTDSESIEHGPRVARIVTTLKRELEAPTSEGFGYRVDLDLRPEGRSGALALSVDGALRYYESFGAEWERQMLIRLRHVAGDARAAADFAREITPFVFRRTIDPQVMQRVHAMKDRVESQRRAAGQNLEDDLKEGPGGIRDVEFLAQSLQLFHGGRDVGVRSGNTLLALAALGERDLLPEATTAALRNAYLWLRRAEHALQLAEEQQTARFPRGAADQTALARRMGYGDVVGERARARLLEDQTAVRGEVRHHFEALALRDPRDAGPRSTAAGRRVKHPLEARLREALAGTALVSDVARAAEPLCERAGDQPALAQLSEPVVAGLARAVASQPASAGFLARRPVLVDRLATATPETLAARAAELPDWDFDDGGEDLEGGLDALRLLRREETLVAACLHLGGLADLESLSGFLSVLAETITRRALDLARRSGPEFPFAVLGMGKIAGREFTHQSDLDLVFLYEGGPEAIDAASRMGQRMLSYLTTMTGAGVAYAVDARLRPSGGQGTLVTSFSAFERYQCEQAATWEHVAMLRARPIAGDAECAAEALARVRARVLDDHPAAWAEIAEVRGRVEKERSARAGALSLKTGPGGLMDVDFLAGGALLERPPAAYPEIPSVPAMLRAAHPGAASEALLADYTLLRRVEAAARWAAGRAIDALDEQALPVAAALTEPGLTGSALRERLEAARARVRAAWTRVTEAGSIEALPS